MHRETNCDKKHNKNTNKNNNNATNQEEEFKISGMTKLEFTNWLKTMSIDVRSLSLRVTAPDFVQFLLENHQWLHRRCTVETDSKKNRVGKNQKNAVILMECFVDGLMIFSNESYLDSIGFQDCFLENPQKMFDVLKSLSTHLNNTKIKIKTSSNDQKVVCSEQLLLSVLELFENNWKQKNKIEDFNIQKNKTERKQFGNFWKKMSSDQKLKLIEIKINEQIAEGTQNENSQIEEVINQLIDLDKNQVWNKVSRCKVINFSTTTFSYFKQLYKKIKQILSNRKQKKLQIQEENQVFSQKKRSLSQRSDQTNQTSLKNSRQSSLDSEIFKHLNEDVIECCDHISQSSNLFYERRVIAFQRIQAIFAIYGVPCKLFGSCASGITIGNSDVDIAIGENILQYFSTSEDKKTQTQQTFSMISALFERFNWIKNIKVIKSASIPIIKLTIDTRIPMGDGIFTQQYLQILNRQHQNSGEVNIDLTIQTKSNDQKYNHLGVVTTEQINKWLSQFPSLRPIIIILKHELSKKQLNETYLGGLNTYCLVIIAVAYIKCYHYEKQQNVGIVLSGFLRFYGWQFDEGFYLIDLRNSQNIYCQKQQNNSFAELEVRDPLNNGRVITKNCYQFRRIKQIFQQIYRNCVSRKQEIIKQQLIIVQKKLSKKKTKQESETESGSERQKFKNYFLQLIY